MLRKVKLKKVVIGICLERYKEVDVIDSDYKLINIKKVCNISKGSTITKKTAVEGEIPVIAGGQPAYFITNQIGRVILSLLVLQVHMQVLLIILKNQFMLQIVQRLNQR